MVGSEQDAQTMGQAWGYKNFNLSVRLYHCTVYAFIRSFRSNYLAIECALLVYRLKKRTCGERMRALDFQKLTTNDDMSISILPAKVLTGLAWKHTIPHPMDQCLAYGCCIKPFVLVGCFLSLPLHIRLVISLSKRYYSGKCWPSLAVSMYTTGTVWVNT